MPSRPPGAPGAASGASGGAPVPGPGGYFTRERWATTSWGLGDVAVGFVLAEVGGGLLAALLLLATGYTADNIPLWLDYVAEVPLWIFLIGVPVVATRLKGDGPVADLGLRMRWVDVPIGIVVGVLGQQVLVGLVYWPIFKVIGHSVDVGQVAQNLTDKAHGVGGEVLIFALVALGAPIAEEIFFRGLTQRALLKKEGLAHWNPWFAIVATAAFFAASHFEPVQFPALFVFGLVLGLLAWRSGRLGPSIWAHLSFNAVAAATLVWHLNLPSFTP